MNRDDCHSRRYRWLTLVVVGLVFILAAWFAAGFVSTRTRSDTVLRQHFVEHHASFVELKDRLMSEQRLRCVGSDFLSCVVPARGRETSQSFWRHNDCWDTDRGDDARGGTGLAVTLGYVGISHTHFDDYLSLLGCVGASRVCWSDRSTPYEEVSFWLQASGNVASSVLIEIVYFPAGIPAHCVIVDDTGEAPDESECYAPLGDGWFIRRSIS